MPRSHHSPSTSARKSAPCVTPVTQSIDLRVSQFSNAYNKTPLEVHDLTWGEFVGALPDLLAVERGAKNSLPALVYADVKGTRCNKNTDAHTALAIDVDRVPKGFLRGLERKGVRCVVYETPSSGLKTKNNPDGAQRLRVVASLTEQVPTHAVRAARTALARKLGLDPKASGVSTADAISQLMFAGRIRGTPVRRMWEVDGEPWTAPPPGDAPKENNPATYGETSSPSYSPARIPDLSLLLNAIKPEKGDFENRGGHLVIRAIGKVSAERGYHPEAIERACLDVSSRDPAERAADARKGAEDYYAGVSNVAGWDLLKKHFGQEVMQSFEKATTDPWWQSFLEHREARKARAANDTGADDQYWTFDFTQNAKPPEMLCARLGLVREGGRVNVIVGEPGKGKTWSAMSIALAVATGKKVFGAFDCESGVVRHIDSDMGARTTMRRYGKLARGMGVDLREVTRSRRLGVAGGVCLTSGGKPNPAAYERLQATLQGVDLLVIDSLISVAPGIDENSSAFAEVVKNLMRVSDATNTTMLMLHHPGKSVTSKKGRGTSALDADWGAWWVLDAGGRWTQNKKHGDVDELSEPFVTAFEAAGSAGAQLSDAAGSVRIHVVGSEESDDAERKRVARFIGSYGTEGCSERDAVEGLADEGVSRTAVRRAVASLLDENLCHRGGGGQGKRSSVLVVSDAGAKFCGIGESLSTRRARVSHAPK